MRDKRGTTHTPDQTCRKAGRERRGQALSSNSQNSPGCGQRGGRAADFRPQAPREAPAVWQPHLLHGAGLECGLRQGVRTPGPPTAWSPAPLQVPEGPTVPHPACPPATLGQPCPSSGLDLVGNPAPRPPTPRRGGHWCMGKRRSPLEEAPGEGRSPRVGTLRTQKRLTKPQTVNDELSLNS